MPSIAVSHATRVAQSLLANARAYRLAGYGYWYWFSHGAPDGLAETA